MKQPSRRALLLATAAAALVCATERTTRAMGRTSLGGSIKLHLPWPIAAIDPHRLDDIAAAVLGDALFDTLYARDGASPDGGFVPSLAESEPQALPSGGLRVVMRGGLTTAHGRAIDAHDVAFALERSRALGAHAWLGSLAPPRLDGDDALIFAAREPGYLMRTLSSPLTAIVPIGFSSAIPDGTGPLRATRRGDALALVRNGNAARGASFLDEVVIRHASALDVSLRAFETGADDVGWLGSGYLDTRAGSQPFDVGAVGWALLRSGREAGTQWDAPGVAQALADSLPPASFSSFFLGPPWPVTAGGGWGGPPCDLLVRDDAPWLVELAKTIAATLSVSSAVTAKPIPAYELSQRRASRAYALAVDATRPFIHGALGAHAALATADDPATAVDAVKHPPRGGDMSPRALARMMRIGVIGEIRVQGGRVPDLVLPVSANAFGVDLGASTRTR